MFNLLRKEVFTQQRQEEDEEAIRKKQFSDALKRELVEQSRQLLNSDSLVSMNFESFCKAFELGRPCFFYDLLYVMAGVRYSHLEYPPQEYPKIPTVDTGLAPKQVPPVEKFGKLLHQMRQTCRELTSQIP